MKPFAGDWQLGTGWRYSSGAGHFAHDYPMPIGTPLYAISDGVIAACADGIPNDEDQPGDTDYTNEPSNWVLLWTRWKGRPVTVYYQHMSPGLKVHVHQQVKGGALLGFSGDSGNSGGPHLHIATMWGHQMSRYLYMSNDGDNPYIIYPPSMLWKGEPDVAQMTKQEQKDFAEMVADAVLRRPVFGDEAPKDLRGVTVREALRRSYLGHDEPREV